MRKTDDEPNDKMPPNSGAFLFAAVLFSVFGFLAGHQFALIEVGHSCEKINGVVANGKAFECHKK
jgi:hypothetical protein